MSWRWVFVLYALPGLLWAALFYLWIREPSSSESSPDAAVPREREAGAWATIVASPSMWLLCSQQFLRAAAMIFFSTWFPTFLRESRGASLEGAGYLTMLAGIGVVVGGLLGGFASDKMLRLTGNPRLSRQGIAVAGMTLCATLIVCADFIANTTLSVTIISIAAFCASFGGVSGYVVAMDLGGRRVATVMAIMNTCGNVGAAAFPIVIGWLVQRSGNWNLVMFVFAGIFAVDAVCWAMLNPKRPLFAEE
jgi:predicted MFS family arabinose efflux permease